MKKQTKYPVVLLHGMFGWGQQQLLERVVPYFGFYNVNIRKMFQKEGIHTVSPSMGPFTGAWDRACEVYAQLVGSTVDYGKAHSAKYGHERFGRTYTKALLPEWGSLHGCRTVRLPVLGWQIPRLKSVPVFNIIGFLIGLQTKGAPNKSYRPNDMLVNEVCGQAPSGDPRTDESGFPKPGNPYSPGIWHVFPVEIKDHLSYCGWAEPRKDYAEFYRNIYNTVSLLHPTDPRS